MEVIKSNTKVAIETIGEAPNLSTKSKMAENQFKFASTDKIAVDQLKLNAENKSTTKLIQTWVYRWQMKENSTITWRSTSTKISIKSYKCFTLKYMPKMDSFIVLLRI